MASWMRREWRHAAAGVLGLAVSSAAVAQQPAIGLPGGPIPPAPPVVAVQPPSEHLAPIVPAGVPQLPGSMTPITPETPAPMAPGAASRSPSSAQNMTSPDPLISSQPPPFMAGQGAPQPTTNAQGYAGNRPVQDLSSLFTGNYSDTKYKWYGFVRLDGIYDFRPMASTDSFVTSSIPAPQGRGQNTVLTGRYTRFGFDTETPIKSLDWELKTRIEVDFFNGNTSGAFGSYPLRLRFAWADFGPFLIGQAASGFMDYDAFPNVLDYQGPPGFVVMRQPLFALRIPVGDKLRFQFGVEQPYSDIQWQENGAWVVNPGTGIITTPGVGRNVQDVPDFTANARYGGDYGHAQVAGILRKLTFQPGPGNGAFDTLGYGINATATFHPWAAMSDTPRSGDCATPMSKSRFLGQFAAGRGISRYFNDENGLALDATYDPINGMRALPSYGWFVGYEHWWANQLASVLTFSQDAVDLTDTLPGSTYQRAEYVSANLIWLPVQRLGVGLEYLYGCRKNKDGERGENSRIQMAFQYRF